jgi:hypothetical protein
VSGASAAGPAPLTPTGVDQGGETVVRRFVTVLAVTVGGLCFLFSLGNVYQIAVDLELWVWIRPLVAPAVDLSLVALVVGIRFLAPPRRHRPGAAPPQAVHARGGACGLGAQHRRRRGRARLG